MFVLLYHCVIGSIVPQIRRRAIVCLAAGHREHVCQMAIALIIREMRKFFTDSDFGLVLFRYHFQIAARRIISQQILRYSVKTGKLLCNLSTCCAIFVICKFLINLSYIGIGSVLRILYQLPIRCRFISRIIIQVFAGRSIVSPILFSKFCPDTVFHLKLSKFLRNTIFIIRGRCKHILICFVLRQIVISGFKLTILGLPVGMAFLMIKLIFNMGFIFSIGIFHHHIGLVLLQIVFRLCVGLCRTRLGELLPQRNLPAALLKRFILFFYSCFIISCVLLQALNIGAFVVFRAGNQACINPVVDQVIFVHIVDTVLLGQCVNEATVRCFQTHIAVP